MVRKSHKMQDIKHKPIHFIDIISNCNMYIMIDYDLTAKAIAPSTKPEVNRKTEPFLSF